MIEYVLTRSKRKTIGIIVKEGKVFVKAPMRISKAQIESFVNDNMQWIMSKLAKRETMHERFSDVLDFKKFLFRGGELETEFTDKKSIRIEEGKIYLPLNCTGRLSTLLTREYKRKANVFLKDRVDELADIMKATYNKFVLTNAKTKWGSCSSDGVLRLNWRLLLLPDELIDYVIVHELCHTKELNHSAKFWSLVESFLPDYSRRRKALKNCVPLIELCR